MRKEREKEDRYLTDGQSQTGERMSVGRRIGGNRQTEDEDLTGGKYLRNERGVYCHGRSPVPGVG